MSGNNSKLLRDVMVILKIINVHALFVGLIVLIQTKNETSTVRAHLNTWRKSPRREQDMHEPKIVVFHLTRRWF